MFMRADRRDRLRVVSGSLVDIRTCDGRCAWRGWGERAMRLIGRHAAMDKRDPLSSNISILDRSRHAATSRSVTLSSSIEGRICVALDLGEKR